MSALSLNVSDTPEQVGEVLLEKGSSYTVDNKHHSGKMGFALMHQCKRLYSWQEVTVQWKPSLSLS